MNLKSQSWEELREEVENMELHCIIEPGLLQTGGMMALTGRPGSGKSFCAQQIAYEIADGKRVFGLFPSVQSKVLYCELEARGQQPKARLVREDWQKEYKHFKENVRFITQQFSLENPETIGKLRKEIEEMKHSLVIFDSFSVTIGDKNDEVRIQRIIQTMRELAEKLSVSFLLIIHLKKPQERFVQRDGSLLEPSITLEDLKGVYTQQYLIDTAIAIEKHKDSPGKRTISFLKHSFSPILYDEKEPLEFAYNGDSPVPFYCKESKILKLLDSGIYSVPKIVKTLGVGHVRQLKPYMDRLEDLGLIEFHAGSKGRGNASECYPIKWKGARVMK